MANNVLFKTTLLKGPQGDRGEVGEADAVPVDGILAYDGATIPEGYEETTTPQVISDLVTTVAQNTEDISTLNTEYNDLDSRVDTNEDNITVQTARIDAIASLPSGSTSGDAELIDIRVTWDGRTYDTAGNAVRAQVGDALKTARNINGTIDCNNQTNGVQLFNVNATLTNGPGSTFTDWQDGGMWMLETFNTTVGVSWQRIHTAKNNIYARSCVRVKNNNSWGSWSIVDPGLAVRNTLSGTIDCNNQSNNVVMFNVEATLTNGPSNFTDWQDGGMWIIETYSTRNSYNHDIRFQMIYKATFDERLRRACRVHDYNGWGNWSIIDSIPYFTVNKSFNGTIDCNAQSNNTVLFNVNATLTNGPDDSTFSDWKDGSVWKLDTYTSTDSSVSTPVPYVFQVISKLSQTKSARTCARTKVNGTWGSWSAYAGASTSAVFHVGSGQTYTRLRDGIAAAVANTNATVYVHPGTYDLVSEFATEIAAATGDVGIILKNGVHVIFYDGAKVTANFDNSQSTYDATTWRWIYDHFAPFYADLYNSNSNFILENLDIEASNTRYCVHDELGGNYTYRHEYRNCRMKYYTDHSDTSYLQCIGGGLGRHGTIIIDGGYYETYTEYGTASIDSGDKDSAQQCISYHNGNNSECYGTITVKNVYLKNRGYMRFGWWGNSDITSHVQISGCSTGLPTLVRYETSGISTPKNFDLTEFCNELRNPSHWTLDANYYVATLVEDQ